MTSLPASGPPSTPPSRRERRLLRLFALVAFLLPLGVAAATGHTWEDFFITFRHSENLARGQGLVFQPGERVHGFTSPLGVLLPALLQRLSGASTHLVPLWLFRAVCAAAFAAGGLLLVRAVRGGPAGRLAAAALAALYLVEAKSITFTISGMETGLVFLFLAWTLHLLAQPRPRWTRLGLAWAGLMWCRPDGCIYVAAASAAWLAFTPLPRREAVRGLVAAGLVTTAVYLPWFAGAWAYYGSPIPHTVTAKAAAPHFATVPDALGWRLLEGAQLVFAPAYLRLGGWPDWIGPASAAVCAVAAGYWVLPTGDRVGRTASLLFLLLLGYLALIPYPFPWYLPSVAVVGLVALARALATLHGRGGAPARRAAAALLGAVLVIGMGRLLVQTSHQLRVQQRVIEDEVRTALGRWLRERVRPDERVFVECAGYVGYFSQARLLDSIGLVAPEVVRLRRERGLTFAALVPALDPEWLVLRPHEVGMIRAGAPLALERYEPVALFDASEQLRAHTALPGLGFLLYDARFLVLRRRDLD